EALADVPLEHQVLVVLLGRAVGDDQDPVERGHDLAHRERDRAGVDADQEVRAPVLDEVPGVLHAHVDLQLLVAEVQLDGAAPDPALPVDLLHGERGAFAHELAISAQRPGKDALAADLDRLLELEVRAGGKARARQREAGSGERGGLKETASSGSASRCHERPPTARGGAMIVPASPECQSAVQACARLMPVLLPVELDAGLVYNRTS